GRDRRDPGVRGRADPGDEVARRGRREAPGAVRPHGRASVTGERVADRVPGCRRDRERAAGLDRAGHAGADVEVVDRAHPLAGRVTSMWSGGPIASKLPLVPVNAPVETTM